MKNNITSIKFPNIKIINKITKSKAYNSCSDIMGNEDIKLTQPILTYSNEVQNINFNINGQDYNLNNEKDVKSYLYTNSERRKINLNNLRLKADPKSVDSKNKINNKYYLPVLMEKRIDQTKLFNYINEIKTINKNKGNKYPNYFNTIRNNEYNDINNFNTNSISLSLNTISNVSSNIKKNNKEIKIKSKLKNLNNSKIKKNNKYDYLEQVKNYRRMLKQQIINRYKSQYSQHGIKKEKKLENENNHFVFNYRNNSSIKNMNENVNKALNIFYSKIPNSRVTGYEKVFLAHTNSNTEKEILNNEDQKVVNSLNINQIE